MKLPLITFALCLAFLVNFSWAQAQSVDKISFQKFTDSNLNISFVVPKGISASRPDSNQKIDNPLLLNGRTVIRLEWPEMIAQIDTFDIEYDFNHIDWLKAYTSYAGFKINSLKTLKNSRGFTLGSTVFKVKDADALPAFLIIDGSRGYLISGDGKKSDTLVRTIADTFTIENKERKAIDKTQIVQFAGIDLEFRDDFTVQHKSKGKSIVKIITNAATVSESSTIFLLKTGANISHEDNVRKFENEISSMKFTSKIMRQNEIETVFFLTSFDKRKFVGFISSTKDGHSVSMIVPSLSLDPNSWMSGKYYYIKTLRALKKKTN